MLVTIPGKNDQHTTIHHRPSSHHQGPPSHYTHVSPSPGYHQNHPGSLTPHRPTLEGQDHSGPEKPVYLHELPTPPPPSYKYTLYETPHQEEVEPLHHTTPRPSRAIGSVGGGGYRPSDEYRKKHPLHRDHTGDRGHQATRQESPYEPEPTRALPYQV